MLCRRRRGPGCSCCIAPVAFGGLVTAWVCAVAGAPGGAPPRCTARVSLGAQASVELPASITGRVRVVVVRR